MIQCSSDDFIDDTEGISFFGDDWQGIKAGNDAIFEDDQPYTPDDVSEALKANMLSEDSFINHYPNLGSLFCIDDNGSEDEI